MSQNKSVQKRIRQAEKARIRNKHYKSLMKTMIKKVKATKTKEEAEPIFRKAISFIDSIAGKGVIHKNNASNRKSKLAKFVELLS